MKLSELAVKNDYSKDFCDFLAKCKIPGLFICIDDDFNDHDAVNAIYKKLEESVVLKILLGIAEENKEHGLDGPCGPAELQRDWQMKIDKEAAEREKDSLKYYMQKGTDEYIKHCNKDGIFRYSDFIPTP